MAIVEGNIPLQHNISVKDFDHYNPDVRHVTKTIARNLYKRLTYDNIIPDPSFNFHPNGSITVVWTSYNGVELGYIVSTDSYITYFCNNEEYSADICKKSQAYNLDQDSLLFFEKQLKKYFVKTF